MQVPGTIPQEMRELGEQIGRDSALAGQIGTDIILTVGVICADLLVLMYLLEVSRQRKEERESDGNL